MRIEVDMSSESESEIVLCSTCRDSRGGRRRRRRELTDPAPSGCTEAGTLRATRLQVTQRAKRALDRASEPWVVGQG